MPPLFEVLLLFSAPRGYLAEVKRIDQPVDAPKDKLFQWLWIEDMQVTRLAFISMATSPRLQRTFKEGALWFDDVQGELRLASGLIIVLTVDATRVLPSRVQRLVNLHLS